MAEAAEKEFSKFDFSSNEEWKTYWLNVQVPPGVDEDAIRTKYMRKWFKSNKNPDLPTKSATSDPKPSRPSASTPPPQPSQSSNPQTSRSSSDSTASGMGYQQASRQIGTFPPIIFMLNVATLFFSIFYFIPLIGEANWNYYMALKSACLCYALCIYMQYGKPQFNKEWWAGILTSANSQYILMAFTFINGAPIGLAVLPICVAAFYNALNFFSQVSQLMRPDLWRRVQPQVANIQSKQGDMLQWNAKMETWIAVFMLIQMVTPHGNLLQLFLYLQLQRMRYFGDPYVRHAWGMFAKNLDLVFYHRLCPSVLGTVYTKAKNYLSTP